MRNVMVPLPDETPPLPFDLYADRLTRRYGQLAALVMGASSLLWWPTDPYVFAENEAAIAAFSFTRPVVTVLCIALFVALRVLPATRYASFPVYTLGNVLVWITLGGALSRVGDLSGVWFYFCYLIPFAGTFMVAPFGVRALATGIISAAYPAAFLVATPAHLEAEQLPSTLSFLGFAAVVATMLGHAFYRLFQANYAHRVELEARVAERTARLRLLASHLEHSLESERARIARDMHDHAGQLLTALRMEVRLLREARGDAIAASVDRADALIEQTFEALRELIAKLRPRVLDEQGLAPAIEWLTQQVEEASGLPVRCETALPSGVLDEQVELALFRFVQEALNNVVKHASAQQVRIDLRLDGGAVEVSVVDDGVGFDPLHVGTESFGLFGLRERVEALAGQLRLSSAPGEGARVWARIPVDESVAS
jgi:signal transduction histidine kinase